MGAGCLNTGTALMIILVFSIGFFFGIYYERHS